MQRHPRTRPSAGLGLTFRDSRLRRVHCWYPYVEGFSADYVEAQLSARVNSAPLATVYDPFGGAGTTQLAATCMGVRAYYSEINPLMAFVAETKVTAASWCRNNLEVTKEAIVDYVDQLTSDQFSERSREIDLATYRRAFPDRDYFEDVHLRQLLAARDLAHEVAGNELHIVALLGLACVANAVAASNMTRRADLRRRRPDEYKNRVVDVPAMISQSVRDMADDLSYLPLEMETCNLISEDCRALKDAENWAEEFDMAITSPPYLNGTNYFRNTKIELWLMGMIEGEHELGKLRTKAITAGINNVSGHAAASCELAEVEQVAARLDTCAKDSRIPKMVRRYFGDMTDVFETVHHCLRPGAEFVFDIGDSRFYGVHVPTDRMLAMIGQRAGLRLKSRRMLAKRLSRDKTPLVQVELTFVKES
jgi:hypothetical protein